MSDFLSEADTRAFREPVARLLASAPDPQLLWTRLGDELGVLGIAVPEEFGGLGMSLAHLAVVAEELGRQLAPVPFLATIGVATSLLLELATPAQCAEVLPSIISGKSIVAAALTGRCQARATAGGYQLTGTMPFVLHGLAADQLVVRAELDGSPQHFLVPAEEADRAAMTGLDLTRPLATVTLNDASAQLLGPADDSVSAAARAMAAAKVVLSAESLGAASECLRMTVEYLKLRKQFGQPIGSFQAVQHRAADMQGELESARAVVEAAAGTTGAELLALAPVARARSADAFAFIARETIQLHGGIGFTWEHPAHRYFKRSLVDLQLLGHPADQRSELAAQLTG